MRCAWKTCTNEVSARRRFCGLPCKRKFFVDQRRRTLKRMAVAYKGGSCERCGYARCEAALTFHHKEPARKDFSVSARGLTRSWERVRTELDKCVMLCANCHAEVHAKAARAGNGTWKHRVNSANVGLTDAEPSPSVA